MAEEKHVVAHVAHDSWLDSMNKKLAACKKKPSLSHLSTIFRVPPHILEGNERAYEPKIISIGPYHRGNRHLQAMEEHKLHYLRDLLSRSEDETILESIFSEIKAMEPSARLCYSEIIGINGNDFEEMMVLDGCFIIELFIKQKEGFKDDPIHSSLWMLPLISQDLLLLENQLPFFVLQCLFQLVTKSSPCYLVDLALEFYANLFSKNNEIYPAKSIDHLLHLFHSHLLPAPLPDIGGLTIQCPRMPPPAPKSIPSATDLLRAGVKFKRRENARNFLDVKFKKGVMEIPPLSIDDSTNALFRNFIAFEQCYPVAGSHFTSYSMLMNFLINTSNDVDLLNQSKIMEHALGSDGEVALLFNRLCKGVAMDDENCYLQDLFREVIDYSEHVWHSWRASFKRNYFSSPWTIISLLAGIIVFLLTVIMPFFTIYTYFRRAGLSSYVY